MVGTWKIGTGGQTKRTFTGTQAEIVSLAIMLQSMGYETEVTSGPKWSLTATINVDLTTNNNNPTEIEPTPTWELVPHSLEQNIFECGRPFVAGLPTNVKASIENKLKNPQNENVFVVPFQYNEYKNPGLIANAFRVYSMKQMGIDGRQIYTLSLKRSIIVSSNFNVSWSINNVNFVLSTQKVISTYNVPNALRPLLPPSLRADETVPTNDNSVLTANVVIPFYYGWLEQHPAYQMVGNNKVQISQEWIYGKWVADPQNGLYDVLE